MREFRETLHVIDKRLVSLAESNARLEKQVIGNGRMGIVDKVNELEDLVERVSEIQMRHLRDDKIAADARRAREKKRLDAEDEIARENRQFKRKLVLAALGILLTNIGAWAVFYLTNLN